MPYDPRIQYTGDRYLYQAVSGLGQDIANGIQRYRKDQQEGQAADAAFETLVQTAAPLAKSGRIDQSFLDGLGDPSKFAGLSLSQKKAKLGQAATSFKVLLDEADRADRRKTEEDLAQYRNASLGIQKDAVDRRLQQQRDTMSVLMRSIPGSSVAGGDKMRQVQIMDAMAQSPNADPGTVADVLFRQERPLPTFEDQYPSADRMLQPYNIGGKTGVYNRRTGQDRPDASAEALRGVPIQDAEGNVISYGVHSGNKVQMVKDPNALTISDRTRLMDQRAKLLELRQRAVLMEGATPGGLDQIDSDLQEIDRMLGRGGSEASGKSVAAQGDNTPPARQFRVGQRATQNGTVYEFDGKSWKPAR